MDFSSLPRYSGRDDDPADADRDRPDRSAFESSLAVLLGAVAVLVAATAVVGLLVLRSLPMPVPL